MLRTDARTDRWTDAHTTYTTVYPPQTKFARSITNLVEVHWVMLHTQYQSSRPYGFRKENSFQLFPNIDLSKTCDPGAGLFLAPMIYLEQTW